MKEGFSYKINIDYIINKASTLHMNILFYNEIYKATFPQIVIIHVRSVKVMQMGYSLIAPFRKGCVWHFLQKPLNLYFLH